MRLVVWCAWLVACAVLISNWPATHVQAAAAGATPSELVHRFLSGDEIPLAEYRALRRLEAVSRGGKMRASLEAWTELDPVNGLQSEVIRETGSGHIRNRVFRRFLDNETRASDRGQWRQANFTLENYTFGAPLPAGDGLVGVEITPLRADPMLIDGTLFLTPDADLVRVEGRLAKRPSFWTRHVDLIRWYGRVAGVRVPLAMESHAQVRVVGDSWFRVTWEYESVNGQRVGSPSPEPLTTRRMLPQ